MKDNLIALKGGAAVIGGIVSTALGGADNYLWLLIIIMLLDIITGVLKAIEERTLSSAAMRKGILNKVVILLLVAVGVLIDRAFLDAFGSTPAIGDVTIVVRNCIIMWFCVEEGISICENCAVLGVPLPGVVKKVLECVESGVSNSTPKEVFKLLKKVFNIDITFGEKSDDADKEEESSDDETSEHEADDNNGESS